MLKYPGMNCSFVLSGSLLIGFSLSIGLKKTHTTTIPWSSRYSLSGVLTPFLSLLASRSRSPKKKVFAWSPTCWMKNVSFQRVRNFWWILQPQHCTNSTAVRVWVGSPLFNAVFSRGNVFATSRFVAMPTCNRGRRYLIIKSHFFKAFCAVFMRGVADFFFTLLDTECLPAVSGISQLLLLLLYLLLL